MQERRSGWACPGRGPDPHLRVAKVLELYDACDKFCTPRIAPRSDQTAVQFHPTGSFAKATAVNKK
jgi:hypothetical protein